MSIVEKKLSEIGIVLPEAPVPVAAYIPACTAIDRLVFVSGQDCRKDGKLLYEGKLGEELTLEQGKACARQSILNCLAALKSEIGSLDRVKRIVKVNGYIVGSPEFDQQPYVLNGASELLVEVFGDAGKHARAALGIYRLPFGTPIEIEMIVELKD